MRRNLFGRFGVSLQNCQRLQTTRLDVRYPAALTETPFESFAISTARIRCCACCVVSCVTVSSTVTLPVTSFVSEAANQPPEAPTVTCASIVETAAEKLVSIIRRTSMQLVGLSRDPDPTHQQRCDDFVSAMLYGKKITNSQRHWSRLQHWRRQ
jgi:hypothetical protein